MFYLIIKKFLIYLFAITVILSFFNCKKLNALENISDNKKKNEQVYMTLNDAIMMTLRNNRQIQSAYLDRTLQKFSLKVTESKFSPIISFQGNASSQASMSRPQDISVGNNKADKLSSDMYANISKMIPTGGTFSFKWGRTDSNSRNNDATNVIKNNSDQNSMSVGFNQPLLKGGGKNIAMAPIITARRNEIRNRLYLKSTLITTVTEVILAYRSLLETGRQVEISKASLDRAKNLHTVNELLIKAGRMAPMEIVQTEADVASREFSYQQTLNSYDNAQLNLIKLLDIDKNIDVIPVDKIEVKIIEPDQQKCLDLAYTNRSDYISGKLSLEDAKTNLVLAKNNMLWDLSLNSQYSFTDNYDKTAWNLDQQDFQIGIGFTIPVYGDFSREQTLLGAKIALKKGELNFQELAKNVEIEVLDAVRNVKMRNIQVKLAEKARELSEKKLAVEKEKLNLGRSTNFQLVSFQNDLVAAQNSELNARISYLNALTGLDRIIGTTLDTWEIEFKDEKKMEDELN